MTEQLKRLNVAVVLLGPFAPAAMGPQWFRDLKLVGDQTADAAYKDDRFLLSDQLAQFALDYIEASIQPDRLQLATAREDVIATLFDMAVNVLVKLDPQRISAFGLNYSAHFPTGDKKAWHKAGDRLAPKEFWNTAWRGPSGAGLKSLTIQLERDDKDGLKGHANVTVQPSTLVDWGVFINVNDHYEFPETRRCGEVSEILAQLIADSRERAISLITSLVEETRK